MESTNGCGLCCVTFIIFMNWLTLSNLQNLENFAMCNQLQWLVLAGRHVTVLEYWFVLVILAIYAFHWSMLNPVAFCKACLQQWLDTTQNVAALAYRQLTLLATVSELHILQWNVIWFGRGNVCIWGSQCMSIFFMKFVHKVCNLLQSPFWKAGWSSVQLIFRYRFHGLFCLH